MIFLSANSRLLISDQHIRQIDSLFIQHLHSVISLIFGNISLCAPGPDGAVKPGCVVAGCLRGGGGCWWWCVEASVSSCWHLPSQMFHCVLPTTPPEGSAVNSVNPRRAPAPSERTWWWITKPQGCTSIIHYNCYKHRSPESSCGGIRAESWSRRQWKLQDSGHELGSDLCHSFRPPEPEGEGATDRRTLALRPLRSRAETQMLLCYSGKRIPQKTLYTEAEMEEEEEVEQAGRSDYSSDKDVGRHSRNSGTKNNTKYFKAAIINSFISIKWL